MKINDFLTNISIKLNMFAVKNMNNLSLKEDIKEVLKNENILSINIEDNIPVIRIILNGNKDILLKKNKNELIKRAEEIGNNIKSISDKYQIYLIDNSYEIIIVINHRNEVFYGN